MPVTTNRSFCIPNTGDLPAAWGTSAINPNFQYLDSMFGGTTTISLSGATTISLTVPPTTGTSTGAATQSQVALIKFTGALTGTAIIQFSLPGFYIVDNRCTGFFPVQMSPLSGGGNSIGAVPGKKCHVFFDGTDMDYVNMPDPGTAYDLQTNTTTLPAWMRCCTVSPYLLKDGSIFSTSLYPALGQLLGSTYGGDGTNTFGVPDERSRFRLALDNGGATGRVTSAVSGINAAAFNASGGNQSMQQHNHNITQTGHQHFSVDPAGVGLVANGIGANVIVNVGAAVSVIAYGGAVDLRTISTGVGTANISINNIGSGSSQNMPPAIVSFLPLLKT